MQIDKIIKECKSMGYAFLKREDNYLFFSNGIVLIINSDNTLTALINTEPININDYVIK